MNPEHEIRLLPEDLQNQIAAGEVVERPASVLKELIENALDAAATRIHIQIRDGGQSLIKISDNGHGIAAEQLGLALTRHATSKLATLRDLHDIQSFGFRGEALPSIASVSRFRLSSAQVTGEGATLEVLHGKQIRRIQTAMPRGTEIEVNDLFTNIPARLKFLKQPATETRKCADIVLRMALANLHVEFEFLQADRTVFHFLAGQALADRLCAAWPEPILRDVSAIGMTTDGLRIDGLAGDPSTAQARPDRILLYVNKRPVQDKTMLSAVREAYRGRILGKEYPQALVFLEIPAAEVDVNVHPAKTEIRFQDESRVFRAVRRAVLASLDARASARAMPSDARQFAPDAPRPVQPITPLPLEHPIPPIQGARENVPAYAIHDEPKFAMTKNAESLFTPDASVQQPPSSPAPDEVTSEPIPISRTEDTHFRYLGQIAATYLVLSTPRGLSLVDQHAAHERVIHDLLRQHGTRGERQPLLMPLEIHLHPSQTHVVQEVWNDLTGLGFSLELKTAQHLLAHAIPSLLSPGKAKEFLEDILATKPTSMDDLWATMACKSAIKAGDNLTADEALSLLEAWRKLPDRHYCPHGRPVEVSWSIPDLEKLFKRRP